MKNDSNKITVLMICFMIVLLLSIKTQAQHKIEHKLFLHNDRLIFTLPANYEETAKNVYLVRTNQVHEHPGLLHKVFEDSIQTFAIGVVVLPILYSKSHKDSIRANYSYLATIVSEQDTTQIKTKTFKKRYAKSVNADIVMQYQLKLDKHFLNKYTKCKVLAYHKQNIADTYTYFFYNSKSETKIDKEIKNNFNIIKFK